MNFTITIIKGDGIGPEIIPEAIHTLTAIGEKFGHSFTFQEALLGGSAIDIEGTPLPQSTIDSCLSSDSTLLGAIGGPKWDANPPHLRPETGLLGLRSAMQLYANIRPARLFQPLKQACPLRADIAENGIDMVFVRELTGGIYFGKRGREGDSAYDTETYSAGEIRRIAKVAFETAMVRNKNVISIDKANVLESSRLWREIVHEIAADYPEVTVSNMLVDNAAMQLVKNPAQFDVILANNIFGDILSDEAAMITGSIGMLASASLGSTKRGLYEPIHGSAPDIAGQNIANPIATILSAAMMLKYSFGLEAESQAIETAVNSILEKGFRTADIADSSTPQTIGTREMGKLITDEIKR